MNAQGDTRQAGVVLVLVLGVLTLFEIIALAFVTYSTPLRQCDQNPTVEVRDGGCVKEVGTTHTRP